MLDADTKKKIEAEAVRRRARIVEVGFHKDPLRAEAGHWLVKFSTGRGDQEKIAEVIFPKQ